ncbi:hypothetical protein PsorP6_011649 [Peronosclerospora sorghi]|uniref:Uncharacterized protein n=1 Tax=Peronosclerospora sorghi TaxID=230839 RepID=A0ACC0WL53_9STRA|nr:hypothetical protein PsorP6_011649 [Peronosclerospora sorghi]
MRCQTLYLSILGLGQWQQQLQSVQLHNLYLSIGSMHPLSRRSLNSDPTSSDPNEMETSSNLYHNFVWRQPDKVEALESIPNVLTWPDSFPSKT